MRQHKTPLHKTHQLMKHNNTPLHKAPQTTRLVYSLEHVHRDPNILQAGSVVSQLCHAADVLHPGHIRIGVHFHGLRAQELPCSSVVIHASSIMQPQSSICPIGKVSVQMPDESALRAALDSLSCLRMPGVHWRLLDDP
eukprot:scaffold997_cov20-Tisochrysis_lutea.AAC.1